MKIRKLNSLFLYNILGLLVQFYKKKRKQMIFLFRKKRGEKESRNSTLLKIILGMKIIVMRP